MLSQHKCFKTITPIFRKVIIRRYRDFRINHDKPVIISAFMDVRMHYTYLDDGKPAESFEHFHQVLNIDTPFSSEEEAILWCDMNNYQIIESQEFRNEISRREPGCYGPNDNIWKRFNYGWDSD